MELKMTLKEQVHLWAPRKSEKKMKIQIKHNLFLSTFIY